MGAIFSAFAKPVVQVAAVAAPIPGMGAVADILAAIILLCETVPQNKCVPYLSILDEILTIQLFRRSPLGSKMSTSLQIFKAIQEETSP